MENPVKNEKKTLNDAFKRASDNNVLIENLYSKAKSVLAQIQNRSGTDSERVEQFEKDLTIAELFIQNSSSIARIISEIDEILDQISDEIG